jgi:hypothetical protein
LLEEIRRPPEVLEWLDGQDGDEDDD